MSHLYFVGAEGLDFVKVGQSVNPQRRLASLRTGSPYKLKLLRVYEDAGHLEHAILAALRTISPLQGEWFLPPEHDFDAIVAQAQALYQDVHQGTCSLGTNIKMARTALGMQQAQLAHEAQVSQKYMSQIEHDHADPSFSIVKRIAKVLGVSLDRLGQDDAA